MDSSTTWILIVGLLVVVGIALAAYLVFGKEPRRRRLYARAQRLLHQGDWKAALAVVEQIRAMTPLSPTWEGRVQNAEGECYRKAGDAELAAKNFEPGLEHLLKSARLLKLPENEPRDRVGSMMLIEARRLFAASTGAQTAEVRSLLDRILKIQPGQPEAQFWQAMCFLREGQTENTITVLRSILDGPGKQIVDVSFYLGSLLLRQGRAPDALRHFAEANKVEPNSPFVRWQLGTALLAAGGDAGMAVRALQVALGPRGLPLWVKNPERAWVEGFPDPAKSFVHRLASQNKYVCPLFGADIAALVRQAFLALSQAHYRQGNFQESANICEGLLRDAPPTPPVLRALGLSLARLEKYDEAFKHLRTAYEMAEPKDPITAGYLALCGARGKPKRPEDKAANVAWAVRLVSSFQESVVSGQWSVAGKERDTGPAPSHSPLAAPQLNEWSGLCSAIFAEARAAGVPISPEDQRRCADVLASVDACDASAAAVYDQLALAKLESIRPPHAWLYCRAAQQHGFRGERDLELFAVAFQHAAEAGSFFAQRSWKFEDIEYTYLERWAEHHPASFPPGFPPEYPARAEQLLLQRSDAMEKAGQLDAALASAMLLARLLPRSIPGCDRLAQLQYRQGNHEAAAKQLSRWTRLDPADSRPLLRLAVLEQQRGNFAARTDAIDRALQLSQGAARADIAFLGARLALAEVVGSGQWAVGSKDNALLPTAHCPLPTVLFRYLNDCLQSQPGHADALAMLAAIRWQTGDHAKLAEQSAVMRRPDIASGRFQYLAAVTHLAAGDIPTMLDAANRAAADPSLTVESMYLAGLAHLRQNDLPAAQQALQPVGLAKDSPSADHARAILGRQCFTSGVYTDAAYWWQMVDSGKRTAWKLEEPYRTSVFLSALQAYNQGRFEQAAEQFRQAGKLGHRDRNLGPLLGLALFKEGQRLFYHTENQWWNNGQANGSPPVSLIEGWGKAAGFLEQSVKVGFKDPAATYLLALAEKRRGRIEEARNALRKITPPDASVWLQLGLLSLNEGQLAQAEQELAQGWQLDPKSFPIGANLVLTRLSLGRAADAVPVLPAVVALAPNPQEWYLFTLLHGLLRTPDGSRASDPVLSQMTPEDEQRILGVLRRLGHLETASHLLGKLAAARLDSPSPRQTYFEVQILAARRLLDRCEFSAADRLLHGLVGQRDASLPLQAAYFTLQGCASLLTQDFETGIGHFQTALRLSGTDYAIHQNLALAYEWQGQHGKAEMHWNRFFDLLERSRASAGPRESFYSDIIFEGYLRLATVRGEKEHWPQAVQYLEAAQRLRPDNVVTLERLFHMYHQLKKPEQARRMLAQLQQLRPGEPQFELYELDLIEINELDDLDKWLAEVARIMSRHVGNSTVEERGVVMIGNATQFMARVADQLTEQLNKVMKQVRGLDNYQVNWSAVQDVMRDLKREFQKLRRMVAKAHTMATNPEQRRVLRELAEHLDRKIDYCRRWQGE